MSDLYDSDILLWSEQQADLLRRLAAGDKVNEPADWQNLAEEIEAWGKSQARELASRIATILEHLIKLAVSPAADPRAGWRGTIRRGRREIERLLADAPSLRQTIVAVIVAELPTAQAAVSDDLADRRKTPRRNPETLVYAQDQVLGDWLPA